MLSRNIFGALNKALHNIYIYNKKHINSHIRRSRNINLLASIATTGILLLSILILNPPVAPDDLASAATATPSTTSLTFTSTNESASVNVPLRSSNGFFATSTSEEEASFAISTNNYTGYTLSIVASDDNGLLSTANNNGGNTTPSTISSISSITSTSNFSATTTAAEAYNGKWGFRPSKYVSGNNVVTNDSLDPDYLPSPTTTPTVLDKTTTATANNTPNEYTIALGVRVDYDVPAGTYNKTFSLVATANPVAYSITYNKNTNDTVTNLPSTQASDTTNTTITLSNTVPQRAHYSFLGWCNTQPTTSNGVDSCTGNGAVIYNPNGNGTNLTYNINLTTANDATLYAMWKIDTFTQTTEVRYENVDGTWGSYSTVDTQTLNYGASYSWSTAQIANFNSAAYQAASVSSYAVTEAHTNYVSIYRNTFTCTKQYRLQNADGTWGAYTTESTGTIKYGSSCSYSKTVTDYKAGSASATNGAQGSTSASSITANTTLSLDFYRNTYSLTVSASTNTSSPTGSGTYRWGQVVTVGVTKATNVTCTSYGTPTWTQSGTAGTFSSTSGTSVNFTMGKGNATVTATSTASNVAQTITLSKGTGVSSIRIGSTNYSGSSVSLTCGTYNISGNYSSGYEFFSWSRSGSVTVASASSASTTMTVSGTGTLTLNGKQSCVHTTITGTMQDFKPCSSIANGTTGTLTDGRDGTSYTVGKLADGKFWLLDNLALDLTNATVKNNLTANTTNASATTLNYLKNGGGTTSDKYATAGVAAWGSGSSYSAPLINAASKDTTQSYGSGSGFGKIGVYYNYCAASAGSYCYGNGNTSTGSPSDNATEDICPKGWRMPTGGSSGEYKALYAAYSSDKAAFVNALRTPLSGYFRYGSAYNQGAYGLFWSSTRDSNYGMYSLYVGTSNVNPQNYDGRGDGFSIRCILSS